MGNCLVTKLKNVVDNDNLEYFGMSKISVTLSNDFTAGNIMRIGGETDVVNLLDNGSSLSFDESRYLQATKGTDNNLKFLLGKYDRTLVVLLNVDAHTKLEEVLSDNVQNFATFGGFYFDDTNPLDVLTSRTSLETITFQNFREYGDISKFNNLTNLKELTLTYSRYLTGDLASIKDMPNLTKLVLDHVYITDNDNTVAYLQQRGVDVTYIPFT